MKYDFNTIKMKGKVQIDIDKWLRFDNSAIEVRRLNGKLVPTGICRACSIGEGVVGIRGGDLILISKTACDVATTPYVSYTVDGRRYFNIPAEQVVGLFQGKVDIKNLKMCKNYLLFKRIEKRQDSVLYIEEKDTMLGEVIQVSSKSLFQLGDIIAIRDNVSTPIKDGYYAVEEKFVVGKLENGLSIKNMRILNNYVLANPYIPPKVLNSKILETARIDYDNLDYTDINNRNLFKVIYSDSSLKSVKPGDIILADRNFANYMYYENEKYFILEGIESISGKIIERDKICN